MKDHHRDTLPENIVKNREKTALTKHAAQNTHGFNWDFIHVAHLANSRGERVFVF